MGKKKQILLIVFGVCMLITLITLYILRYNIMNYINNTLFIKEISTLNLTKEQKMQDFEEFYNNIMESDPSLGDQEKMYGISFENKKEYYMNLIDQTKNDFEFFCIMSAIEEDIPSMHTDICLPIYSNISNLNCYNNKEMLSRYNLKPLTEYWYKNIGNACKQFSNVQDVSFKYIDGQYLFDPMYSGSDYQDLKGFQVVSINNVPMSEYVVNNISTNKLRYDYKRKVPYREYYILNDSVGEKVNVTLINSENGSTTNKELYFDIQIEVVNLFKDLYEENTQDSSSYKNIYSYCDYEKNIGYVEVENFVNSQGEQLKETIESMKDYDSIIIDLRDNYGGTREYAMDYLYSATYSEDITTELN